MRGNKFTFKTNTCVSNVGQGSILERFFDIFGKFRDRSGLTLFIIYREIMQQKMQAFFFNVSLIFTFY